MGQGHGQQFKGDEHGEDLEWLGNFRDFLLKKRQATQLPAAKRWTESLWELADGKGGPRKLPA